MTAELLAVIDGEAVPLLDCFWGMFAPCGCLSGATVVGHRDPRYSGNGIKATEDDAWSSMYDSAPQRERDREAGFRFELMTRERYKTLAMSCDHSPKWGVPEIPQVDGMRWAVKVGNRRPAKTARLHLVPANVVNLTHRERWADGRPPKIAPLCGQKPSDDRWKDDWPDVDGQIECEACVKAAAQAVSA